MQFAISKLGFQPHDIVLYAWSIGGYSASWAAMTFPDLKHVVRTQHTRPQRRFSYTTVYLHPTIYDTLCANYFA